MAIIRAVSVTRMLNECYKSVTRVLQECCKGVTRVLQGCYRGVTKECDSHKGVTLSAVKGS